MGFRRWLLILVWVAGMSWTAQGKQLAVIADTANPTTNLTTAELVKIVNARTQTWPDGRAIKLIVRDPSCADMQLVVRHAEVLPLTTKSPEARRLAEEAMMLDLDQVEQAKAIEILRKTVKIDPDFAMAHEFLTQISLDPAEQVSEQQKAFATRNHASAGERLA